MGALQIPRPYIVLHNSSKSYCVEKLLLSAWHLRQVRILSASIESGSNLVCMRSLIFKSSDLCFKNVLFSFHRDVDGDGRFQFFRSIVEMMTENRFLLFLALILLPQCCQAGEWMTARGEKLHPKSFSTSGLYYKSQYDRNLRRWRRKLRYKFWRNNLRR